MLEELMENDGVLGIFEYGSIVYGTNNELSDKDYIVIVIDSIKSETGIGGVNIKGKDGNDYNFYTISNWKTKMEELHLEALEISYMHEKHCIKYLSGSNLFCMTIGKKDKVKTRQRISSVASNSWDKARKKLIVEKDFSPRTAKKSLWHSIRILNYGKQLLLYGYIKDYGAMNYMYDEIVNCPINDWDYYDKKYRPLLLAMRTEFRELSQPEWDEFKNNK